MSSTNPLSSVWLYLVPLLLSTSITPPCPAAEESVVASVRRIDPLSGNFFPVDTASIKPGKIYNHFSPRHGRYVWAFAKEGGTFSYALGPGSTELPGNFDLVTSPRQTEELVEEAAGAWFERSLQERSPIYVRLGSDDRWHIVPARSLRSHFDSDSGQRWEWHGKRRVGVMHTQGNLWTSSGDEYLHAIPWHASTFWYDMPNSCTPCDGSNLQ